MTRSLTRLGSRTLSSNSAVPLEELTGVEAMARKNSPMVLAEIKTLQTINGHPAASFWKQGAVETKDLSRK